MNQRVLSLFFPVLLLGQSGVSYAAKIGPYLGGGAGYSQLEAPLDLTETTNGGLGGRFFVGTNFSRTWGVEVNYGLLSKTSYVAEAVPGIAVDYKLNYISIVAKAYLPLSKTTPFDIYALAGGAKVLSRLDGNYFTFPVLKETMDAMVPTYGVGINLEFSNRLSSQLELSTINQKNENPATYELGFPESTLLTLNVSYQF